MFLLSLIAASSGVERVFVRAQNKHERSFGRVVLYTISTLITKHDIIKEKLKVQYCIISDIIMMSY